MDAPRYVDISQFQPTTIDWVAYRDWSAQWDGVSRVALRSSYGTGFTDAHYRTYRAGAEAAGITVIIHYHYAYPQYNSAVAEADYQHSVVGQIRPLDVLMLDYEENVSQATAEWAYAWLTRQEQNAGGKLPTIYASDSYIRTRLQDARLARYPLTLANWQFDPNARPPCPPPWTHYEYLQYTDRATNIPGIAGSVDADVYLGGSMPVPTGWHDNGTTLVAPNNVPVVSGFRSYILTHSWEAGNWPLAPEAGRDPLEDSNPSLGSGTYQVFRWSMLEWTPVRGVFMAWIGQELLKARQELDAFSAG